MFAAREFSQMNLQTIKEQESSPCRSETSSKRVYFTISKHFSIFNIHNGKKEVLDIKYWLFRVSSSPLSHWNISTTFGEDPCHSRKCKTRTRIRPNHHCDCSHCWEIQAFGRVSCSYCWHIFLPLDCLIRSLLYQTIIAALNLLKTVSWLQHLNFLILCNLWSENSLLQHINPQEKNWHERKFAEEILLWRSAHI